MSKLSDNEIQELLDQGVLKHTVEESDRYSLGLYKTLFEELDKIPQIKLPYGFSGKVINRFEQSKSSKNKLRIYVYTGLAAILCLTGAGLVLKELLGSESMNLYKWLLNYKGMILFIAISIALIQLLDDLFVKKRRTYFN